MPIYAYRCDTCGHAKGVPQKMSSAPLMDCPACGTPVFKKQLTAAGFQLRGSGWYVTNFHGSSDGAPAAAPTTGLAAKTEPAAPAATAASSDSASSSASTPAAFGGCDTSCAYH